MKQSEGGPKIGDVLEINMTEYELPDDISQQLSDLLSQLKEGTCIILLLSKLYRINKVFVVNVIIAIII